MKTGYIRASGFNLVASMRRDGRHIIGVVMGGRSSSSRDAHMRDLLEKNIKLAAKGGGTMMFANATAPVNAPLPPVRPDMASLPVASSPAQTVPAPILVVPSTTLPGTLVTAGMSGKPTTLDSDAMVALIEQPTGTIAASAAAPVEQGDTNTDIAADTIPDAGTAAVAHSGEWVIQVGAFNDKRLALDTLERARTSAPTVLTEATAFTETIEKNGETLWRARFAGFDQPGAEGACAHLKRQSFGCFPARN